MQQAQEAVCWADSDDDDYVSFDEDELNTGIANLYDEDSASDYNDDVEEEEEVDLENIDIVQDAMQPPPPQAPPQQQQQQKQRSISPVATAARFSFNLFGSSNDKSNQKEKRKNSDSGSGGGLMSAFSARSAAPQRNKKKSKSSQLNKRINRLREHQHKSRAVKKDKKVVHRQKVNTNVISIDLGTLKNAAENIATGDPFICGSCKCMLSKHDELLKKYEEIKLDDEDDSIWVCSFCNHINIIQIDEEEIPKAETVDYIIAPPPTMTDDDAKAADSNKNESQIIFCIDVSGSMCVSQQIDSKHSHFKLRGNRLQKEHDNLSQFIDHNANHLNQQSEIQYVSRLQCVQTAVKEQIDNIAKSNPNYKLGLVSFNNEVTVIGDGMGTHEIVTGDKLNDIEKLKEIGMKCIIDNNIETAKDKLSEALWKLEENGQTALGPALVVSIAMASAKPGSQVILCTDGLANIGVGSLDQVDNAQKKDKAVNDQIESEDDEEEEEEDPVLKWYQALGDYAMSKGVVVNIISITDDGCKLENLGKIVEITGGSLKRINPLNLAEKFSGIIENESIATNCQAKMLLHPGLKFHNTVDAAQIKEEDEAESKKKKKSAAKPQQEEQKDDKEPMDVDKENEDDSDKKNEGRKIYKIPQSAQDCGNVFEGSRIFFEYVINKEKRSEFKTLKKLPFQTQIEYSKKDGTKMLRVISQTKEITFDRKKVRDNLDFNVLAKYGTHVTTELCAKGDYESSRAWTAANTRYMNNNANNRRQLLQLANYAQENVVLDHQMQRQIQSEFLDEAAAPQSASMYNNNNNNNNAFSGFTYDAASSNSSLRSKGKKSKKKKMAYRKTARNDQFSSAVYNMKKKSHK